jgi:PAS domain S-box-containing protein
VYGTIDAIDFLCRGRDAPDAEPLESMARFAGETEQCVDRGPAEAELRRSHAFMRATLNAAFDAIVTMDAQGMIIGANPAAEELFGRPATELVGHELAATIIPPSLRDLHRQGLARFIASGTERVVGHAVELRAMRADGTEFPVEIAIRRLEVPGRPVFTGFIRDLTVRRVAEAEARLLADEQAALHRVATLVTRGADTGAVFQAVTKEVARLCGAEAANMIRYQRDDTAVVIGAWSDGSSGSVSLGTIVPLDGDSAGPQIRRTGAPVRVDSFVPGRGRLGETLSRLGFTAAVGAPVVVDDKLWGAVIVRSTTGPFPDGAEFRLQAFAELAGQALANAEAREQLAASRARLVAAGMEERRRLERNLHDGAQQRLVAVALMLRMTAQHVEDDPRRVRHELASASEELARALSELREIARGLHPAVLSDRGLEAGIQSLCNRAPVPVDVEVQLEGRPGDAVGAAAYYVVAEALTNVAKYANATAARVELRAREGVLDVDVSDDGVGGADRRGGSGLSGLTDRVVALGGRLAVDSPLGRGTRIHAELPL